MKTALTFAIPFLGALPYLRVAVESVLGQARGDWRLLVQDDASPDSHAEELVASFRDDRVQYGRNDPRLGMVENWNLCLDRAETDLVNLLHCDDRLLPHYADTILELAAEFPNAAAYFCGASIIDQAGRPCASLPDAAKSLYTPRGGGPILLAGEAALRRVMAGNFIMCPTLCFRRSVLADRRFQKRWRQVQDLELTTRLLMEGETLAGSRRVSYAYRRHDEAATRRHSDTRIRFDEEFALFEEIAKHCDGLGWKRAAEVARRQTIIKLHLSYRVLKELLGLKLRSALSTLRYLRAQW